MCDNILGVFVEESPFSIGASIVNIDGVPIVKFFGIYVGKNNYDFGNIFYSKEIKTYEKREILIENFEDFYSLYEELIGSIVYINDNNIALSFFAEILGRGKIKAEIFRNFRSVKRKPGELLISCNPLNKAIGVANMRVQELEDGCG